MSYHVPSANPSHANADSPGCLGGIGAVIGIERSIMAAVRFIEKRHAPATTLVGTNHSGALTAIISIVVLVVSLILFLSTYRRIYRWFLCAGAIGLIALFLPEALTRVTAFFLWKPLVGGLVILLAGCGTFTSVLPWGDPEASTPAPTSMRLTGWLCLLGAMLVLLASLSPILGFLDTGRGTWIGPRQNGIVTGSLSVLAGLLSLRPMIAVTHDRLVLQLLAISALVIALCFLPVAITRHVLTGWGDALLGCLIILISAANDVTLRGHRQERAGNHHGS